MTMTRIGEADQDAFFMDVNAAATKAVWCALATVANGRPRVRTVHPTWEGDVLWIATATNSAKARQIAANPWVDVQWQVAPPNFVHVVMRGRAHLCNDDVSKRRAWDVIDYDLQDFFSGGPTDPNYVAVKVVPTRVELSEMFGSLNKRVWRTKTDL